MVVFVQSEAVPAADAPADADIVAVDWLDGTVALALAPADELMHDICGWKLAVRASCDPERAV